MNLYQEPNMQFKLDLYCKPRSPRYRILKLQLPTVWLQQTGWSWCLSRNQNFTKTNFYNKQISWITEVKTQFFPIDHKCPRCFFFKVTKDINISQSKYLILGQFMQDVFQKMQEGHFLVLMSFKVTVQYSTVQYSTVQYRVQYTL